MNVEALVLTIVHQATTIREQAELIAALRDLLAKTEKPQSSTPPAPSPTLAPP